MHYAVPVLLHQAGMLAHFFTDVYVGPGSSWHVLALAALLPTTWQTPALKRLLSRRVDGLPPEKVTAFNMLGLSYTLAQKRAGDLEELERVFLEYGRKFCDLILREPINPAQAIYAFEVTALPLFHWAGKLGITKILEKFSAPYLIDFGTCFRRAPPVAGMGISVLHRQTISGNTCQGATQNGMPRTLLSAPPILWLQAYLPGGCREKNCTSCHMA